jgi:hypothetical protein
VVTSTALSPSVGSSFGQVRYAAGVREILECWFEGRPIRNEYLIVQGGKLAGAGAHSYSAGDATHGSEEAARFKTPKGAGEGFGALLRDRFRISS